MMNISTFYKSKLFRFLFDTKFGLNLIRKSIYVRPCYYEIYDVFTSNRFWHSWVVMRVFKFFSTLIVVGICLYMMWFETSISAVIIKIIYIVFIIWLVSNRLYYAVLYVIHWLVIEYVCLINGLIVIKSKIARISQVLDDGSFIDDNGNHIKPIIPISDVYNAISYYNCKNVTYFEFPKEVRSAMMDDTYEYLTDMFRFGSKIIIHYDL